LEGLPLAIELAAARVNVLAPVVILERLDRRLPVLSRGLRDAPDRQRTLEATITWSYDLLDEDQKSLFTRLSVFAGGWTLEAAEQVCSATLDQLASLIDNSLVRHNGNRYSMLETIREYTLERLRDSGELEAVERRHAAWYIRYVRNHRASAVRQAVGVTPLERELDNLRAALRRLATRGHVTGALRLAADLESLWISKAHLVEGREWLTDGLTYANVTPHVRARALRAAGWVTAHQGDHDAALTMLEHSLRIFRERNEKQFVASTLRRLGLLLTAIGQYECARSTLDEAVAAYTDAGDTTGRSTLANAFAVLAGYEGDLAAARTWLEEDLRHREDIGDRRGYGAILANLGMTAVLQGDYDAAEPLLEQALAIAYELGEAFDSANILATRGTLAIERGNIEQARRDFLTALKTYADARAKTRCAECFDGLGRVALANNEPVKAARLCAAAAATRERTGARLAIAEQKAIDDALASLAEQLDARAFAAAWQRGQTASLDEAVRYALETDVHDARTTPAR
jgi:tetratricopeptide (TPR) repeat protein